MIDTFASKNTPQAVLRRSERAVKDDKDTFMVANDTGLVANSRLRELNKPL